MNINFKAIFRTDDYKVLCFNCAVKEVQQDKEVCVDIDDYSSDYDTRSTKCEKCARWI